MHDQMRETAKDAGKQFPRTPDDLKAKTEDLADHVSERAQAAYGQARERMDQAVEDGRAFLDDARERGERAYRDQREVIERYVDEQPMTALMVAGAIGFGVAWLLFSSRR